MKPICIWNSGDLLGEGPLWCSKSNRLYWVDIKGQSIRFYEPEEGLYQSFPMPSQVSCIAIKEKGGLLAAMGRELVSIDLERLSIKNLIKVEDKFPNNRFNDGKCDAQGRFWIGSMDKSEEKESGSLYCLSNDMSLGKKLSGLIVSNGIGWSPDNTIMYLTDSKARKIFAFEYDLNLGSIHSKRVFANIEKKDGFPDGLAVDADGHVWSAHWDGWKITRYTPDGSVDQVIHMPIPRPTSCAFGGKNLDRLFVTSASFGLSEAEQAEAPLSGGVFEIEVGISGMPISMFNGY